MIYETPELARRRLAELGISVEALQKAVAAGHAARVSTTENDAPQIPGTHAWGMTLRVLRDELCDLRGWRKDDPGNFSLTINDSRQLNIVVESGDRFTRVAHVSPRTKSLKGLFIEAAAIRNKHGHDFFPETLSEELARAATILNYKTYILLIYITEDEYRAELSLPDEVEGNQIVSWFERIFIPDTSDVFDDIRAVPQEDDIDIPVRRKA